MLGFWQMVHCAEPVACTVAAVFTSLASLLRNWGIFMYFAWRKRGHMSVRIFWANSFRWPCQLCVIFRNTDNSANRTSANRSRCSDKLFVHYCLRCIKEISPARSTIMWSVHPYLTKNKLLPPRIPNQCFLTAISNSRGRIPMN